MLKVFVTEPKLKQLNDRIRIVAKAIMVGMLGKVWVEPDPENVPGGNLKSMIEAVGLRKTIDFISIIELKIIEELVQILDERCPGVIDATIKIESAEHGSELFGPELAKTEQKNL